MSQIAFLFDEHVPPSLAGTVRAQEPAIDLASVGQPDVPSRGTSDPDILAFAAETNAIVVTFDKSTMVKHAVERIEAGLAMSGLIVISSDQSSRQRVAEDMVYVWSASTPEEWESKIDYLPYPGNR